MKRRLSIILLAAALAAAPAAGQTVKSLGYNTTNGVVPTSLSTNTLRFTNSEGLQFNKLSTPNMVLGTNGLMTFYGTNSGFIFSAGATAAQFRDDLGLGTTNAVTFGTLNAMQLQVSSGTNLYVNLADDVSEFFVPLQLEDQLAVVGAATFNTNVTVNGNATLNGVGNIAPQQTASSGASLMTRDLVGQEFANPRTKMQTTYWFSMEGLGLWQLVNSGTSLAVNRGAKFGPSLAFYTGTRSSANAAGLGLRLGSTAITGGAMWRPVDGGAFTARTHVVNYFSATTTGNRAFGFSFAAGANTNFWGNPDSFGLFWVQQPTNTWAASTAFTANDRIAVSNVVWAVATAGTTDTNEPVWTDLINSTVTNGTAVFRNLGPHTSNNWVLAIGHTNASGVVMTNTGKSNWLRATGGSGHEVLLTLRYGTNTAAPFTVYGSVGDGTGQGAEVTLNLPTNNVQVSPQYWLRYDGTNSSGANDVAGIRYFSIDAELPPLD